MKKFILVLTEIILVLVSTTNSFAQETILTKHYDSYGYYYTDPKEKTTKLLSNEEFFEKADFIIEGIGTNKHAYSYDINGNYDPNDIYMSGLFIVSYVYKNNTNIKISKGDTLNLIRKGGAIYQKIKDTVSDVWVEKTVWSNSESSDVLMDEPAINFFTKHSLPEDSVVKNNNKYVKVNFLQQKTKAYIKIQNDIRGLNSLSFPNKDSLFSYMKQYEKYGVLPYKHLDEYYLQKKREMDELKQLYSKAQKLNKKNINIDTLMLEIMKKTMFYQSSQEFKEHKKIQEIDIERTNFWNSFVQFQREYSKKKQQQEEQLFNKKKTSG